MGLTYEGDIVRPLGLVTLYSGLAEYEIDSFLERLGQAGLLPSSWSQRPIGQKLTLLTDATRSLGTDIRPVLDSLLEDAYSLLEQRNTVVHGCILTGGRIIAGRAGIEEKRISAEELTALAERIFAWKERLSIFRWKHVEPLLVPGSQ